MTNKNYYLNKFAHANYKSSGFSSLLDISQGIKYFPPAENPNAFWHVPSIKDKYYSPLELIHMGMNVMKKLYQNYIDKESAKEFTWDLLSHSRKIDDDILKKTAKNLGGIVLNSEEQFAKV